MLRLHNAVWQAGSNMVVDDRFQQSVVKQHAETIASTVMLTINAQLDAIGAVKAKEKTETTRQDRMQEIEAICAEALTLKGQMMAAPDYYRWMWAAQGKNVHPTKMEQVHRGSGPQEITWGVTPFIEKRSTQDAPWQTACAAKVFSRSRA